MPEVTALPRPGEVFAGKYLIERIVGSGKNSLVFVAQHCVTGKRFAIEWLVPRAEHARHDALIDDDTNPGADSGRSNAVGASEVRDAGNLVSEAEDLDTGEQQVVGHFRHPNVLEVYDVGEASGSLYTVMEWSDGESLEARIARSGPMSIAEVCELLVPCMRGMHEAHAAGILHRDLKPSNIFLCQPAGRSAPEVAKVLDFEIASEASDKGDASSVVLWRAARESKPYYRAPEQLGGLPVDHRADVYAFGAILYEVLTGRPPFAPVRYSKRDERPSSGVPALQSRSERLPPGADAIIGRAMARDVAKRFQTLHELADTLEALSRSPVAFSQSTIPGPPPFDAEPMRRARSASPPPLSPQVGVEGGDAATDPGVFAHEVSFTRSRPWPRPTRSDASDEPTVPESAWREAPDWSDPKRTSHVPEWSETSHSSYDPPRPGASHEQFYSETPYEARSAFGATSVYPPHLRGYAGGPAPAWARISGATALLAVGAFCFVGLVGFMAYDEWTSRRGDYLRNTDVPLSDEPPPNVAEVHVPAPSFDQLPRGIAPPEDDEEIAQGAQDTEAQRRVSEAAATPRANELSASTAVVASPRPIRLGRGSTETSWNPVRSNKPSSLRAYPSQPNAREADAEPSINRPRPAAQTLVPRPRASAARESRGSSPAPSAPRPNDPADLLPMHLM